MATGPQPVCIATPDLLMGESVSAAGVKGHHVEMGRLKRRSF